MELMDALVAAPSARLVLHRARDVVLGVGELNDLADARDIDDRGPQLTARGLDGGRDCRDRLDADRHAECVDRTLRRGPAPFRDQAARDAVLDRWARVDMVEVGRSADLETPREHLL